MGPIDIDLAVLTATSTEQYQYSKGRGKNGDTVFGSWEPWEWGFGRLSTVKESGRKRKFLIGLGKAEKGVRSVQKRSQFPSKKGDDKDPKKGTDKDPKKGNDKDPKMGTDKDPKMGNDKDLKKEVADTGG